MSGTAVDMRRPVEEGYVKNQRRRRGHEYYFVHTSVQIDASIPRISVHAPLQYELPPHFAKAVKSVVSVLMAGGGPEECRAASSLKEGALPMLDDVLSLYAALATRDEEAMPRVRTFAARNRLRARAEGGRCGGRRRGRPGLGVRKGDFIGGRGHETYEHPSRTLLNGGRAAFIMALAPVIPGGVTAIHRARFAGGASLVLTK